MDNDEEEAPQGLSQEMKERLAEYANLTEPELLARARRSQMMDLLVKLELGLLTHQEHAVLRNLVRDNGLTLTPMPPPDNSPMIEGTVVRKALPAPLPALPDALDEPDYDM